MISRYVLEKGHVQHLTEAVREAAAPGAGS
jgi:hypothetical protein